MKLIAVALVVGLLSGSPQQQPPPLHHDPHGDELGTVDFATSCAPAAHAEFQRGVAMLHSSSTRWSVCGRTRSRRIYRHSRYSRTTTAADFAVYAYLQLAQDIKAKAMIDKATTTPLRGDRPVSIINFTALAAMPARYALERGDWKAASALAVTPTEYPQADSLTRFARGLGMARSRDTQGAKREIDSLEALRRSLTESGASYWADRTSEQKQAVSAWVALAEAAKE
jgi:hypothetical protein